MHDFSLNINLPTIYTNINNSFVTCTLFQNPPDGESTFNLINYSPTTPVDKVSQDQNDVIIIITYSFLGLIKSNTHVPFPRISRILGCITQ